MELIKLDKYSTVFYIVFNPAKMFTHRVALEENRFHQMKSPH